MAFSPDFLPVAQHIYIHAYFVHRTVYMYTITTVHLDFLWAVQVSRPDTRAHIEYPTCSVCVCAYTHSHNIYTSTPCKKCGDTSIAQTYPSHWKQTPTVDMLEKPRSPLFYIRMQ